MQDPIEGYTFIKDLVLQTFGMQMADMSVDAHENGFGCSSDLLLPDNVE